MKHIYESEILNKLMERDGFNIPSSVPPYESEIKAYLIEQVKLAYPKLNDYEAEWLLYNYVKHIPADFPVESVSDVTEATFQNVVPYAFKSAILSGNTLVNIVQNQFPVITWGDNIGNNSYFKNSETAKLFKPDTDYLFIFEGADTITLLTGVGTFFTTNNNDISGKKLKLRTLSSLSSKTFIPHFKSSVGGSLSAEEKDSIRFMIIEYQDGMENWDIPYFEGMQSVKMPVLTTSNEDGTKSNILTVNEPIELRGIGDVQDTLDCLTGEKIERIGEIVLDGTEEWNVSGHSNWTSCYTKKYILPHLINKGTSLISDKMLSYIHYDHLGLNDVIGIAITKEGYICFKYLPNGSKPQPSEVSDYLKSNPITIQYPLETESIKTVDLSIIDQNEKPVKYFMPFEGTMNIRTDGTPLKPTVSMEVPVEAITQNLASFIEMGV